MDFYKGTIPIIDDTPEAMAYAMPQRIDGELIGYGLVPRDFNVHPAEMFDPPTGIQLIPQSEWDARYDEQEKLKSSLEHIYLSGPNGEPAFPNLDQNGHGDCWAFSTGHAVMIDRLKQNLPPVRLNPHGIAVMLNQLNGGWCGLSAKFAREHGIPEDGSGPGQWPGHSRSRSYITAELRERAAKYKAVEEWVDLSRPVHSQNLTEAASATCSFNNIPGPEDFNWWRHSVCRIRHVRIERGSWGKLILNSWPGWGRHGLGVLRDSKMLCDGAMAVRVSTA